MSAWPKLIADCAEHRTEACRVPQTLEPLQTSLTLAVEGVPLSVAVTVMSTKPTSASPGVPAKVRMAGVNISQAGTPVAE